MRYVAILFALVVMSMLACSIEPLSMLATETPTRTPPPTFTPRAATTPTPVRSATPTIKANPPTWYPADLPMPSGAQFSGDASRAVWKTSDVNVNGIRDYFLKQAANAGYKSYVITQSAGSIYDLFFTKGTNAYGINLTQGSDATFLTATRTGIFHLKVSGVTNVELDLPMRSRLDVTPGSEISIGTSIPNLACDQCEYYINVHIAPFKGVWNYDSKPGTYIVDVEAIPGGNTDKDDFRWAIGGCAVTVNPTDGVFSCVQLQNVNDQSKRIDVSGSWQQP
jgi:hypothetical protein